MSVEWFDAYTPVELDRAQDIYGVTFPPDLLAFLSERHPLLNYDWRTDNPALRQMFNWPYDGLLFDVENNNVWLPDWGEKPKTAPERAEVLKAIVDAAPRLIPLYSHRYLPAEPNEAGNPVFSVYQADIIYYGANLANYIDREVNRTPIPVEAIKPIRFWSQFTDGSAYP